jgi:hypothetical protein
MNVQAVWDILDAAWRGDLEAVRRYLQQDRQLVDVQVSGISPLAQAAEFGRVEVVRYLLDEGADINLSPGGSWTALDRACSHGRLQVVALLLARGARTTPADDGWTPLMSAAQKGHTDIVELLLAHREGEQLDRQNSPGRRTALHFACYYGEAGVLRALLGAGADPHVVDHDGRTPLSNAVRRGHAECVALLQVSIEDYVSVYVLGWHGGYILPDVRLSAAPATVPLLPPSSSHLQEWECRYLLSKARRLRDASTTLRLSQTSNVTGISQAPAYVASRVEEGAALPEVEVEGVQAEGGQKRAGTEDNDALLVEDQVVKHVMEGLRVELFREWMGMLDLT